MLIRPEKGKIRLPGKRCECSVVITVESEFEGAGGREEKIVLSAVGRIGGLSYCNGCR
jgi:hypothetical protein